MSAPITKPRALDAAREFVKHRYRLGAWKTSDLLMSKGRLYEFPPGTPDYTGPQTIGAIAEFIQAHAIEIE